MLANGKVNIRIVNLILIVIFSVAIGLRILIAIYNREANDNHIDVVNIIVGQGRLPEKPECWSCYQPKLYYVVSATVIKCLKISSDSGRLVVMQMVSVIAGILTLWLVWLFIAKQPITQIAKCTIFSLVALNPALLGINVQGTNDSLVILWGAVAVYALYKYINQEKLRWVLLITGALVLGALTKASALILFLAISILLVVQLFTASDASQRWKKLKHLLVLVTVFLLITPTAGGYYDNYKKYGSFTLSTWEKDPPPYFFEKTFVNRAGLRSVAEGFFTFRYIDMIRQPYINNEWDNYPLHRTSLWSQLYGRTVFMHFDQWPTGWQSQKPFIIWIGRLLIVLGVFPLICLLIGIAINTLNFIVSFRRLERGYFLLPQQFAFYFIVVAMLLSSVYYTYNYRDFSSMKSIYIFPGVIAFVKLFVDGLRKIPYLLMYPLYTIFAVIAVLNLCDVMFLLFQLKH